MTRSLVLDLGAGSGRAMLASFDGRRLDLEEIHRFGGYAAWRPDGPHWDVAALLAGVSESLRRAAAAEPIDSIGVDSWGLDYGLIDAEGRLVSEPCHYRHPRALRGQADCPVAPEALFAETGAQALAVNTVYQLFDEARHHPQRHAGADRLLMMADIVNHHLTGVAGSELTLARTSGLLDAETGQWSAALCDRLGLPARLLCPPAIPGSILGPLRSDLAAPLGLGEVPVVAVASHDTASAVAALGLDDGSGFLILGSWSLFGVEQGGLDRRPAVLEAGFGNEGGVEGRPFLVKSLNGLHLVQKLRESWLRRTGENVEFDALSRLAAAAPAGGPAIDPADPRFFDPPDMVGAIEEELGRRGASLAGDLGGLAAALYRGLAAEVARACLALESLIGRSLPDLRVCGGGAQDETLCRLIAEATGKALRVGPIEASAWGNAILQLIGLGRVGSLAEGRRLVERSGCGHDPGGFAARKPRVPHAGD